MLQARDSICKKDRLPHLHADPAGGAVAPCGTSGGRDEVEEGDRDALALAAAAVVIEAAEGQVGQAADLCVQAQLLSELLL